MELEKEQYRKFLAQFTAENFLNKVTVGKLERLWPYSNPAASRSPRLTQLAMRSPDGNGRC